MRPILLATDGSPSARAATEEAITLAGELGAPLIAATVEHQPSLAYYGYGTAELYDELKKQAGGQATKTLAEVASLAAAAGVDCETVDLDGVVVVEALCELARQREPELLVVGAHGWGAVKRALFGSVSLGLLHEAPCPVLVVREERKPVEHAHPEAAAT
ncbi:MAG TPA: universal stress protein [Gaiellaceae bacterium]|jgi:nucleotide-binding universal stress UspA family protein|nr:universal stress protein [Gaiellaceae bacterium]